MSLNFVKMLSDINSRRYLRQMQNLIGNKIPCGFFSGFKIPSNVNDIVQSIKNFGINLTCIVVPADEAKETFDDSDIPVFTLMELPKSNLKVNHVLYIGAWLEFCFANYFKRYGIEMLSWQDVGRKENQFNFYMQHLPEIYSVYEMFSDEESKAVYRAYLTGILTGRISDYKFAPESQYFFEGFFPIEGDIVIDGGAYDGATARDFTMQGAKVYAFEMSNENYPKCLERAEKYNFVVENIGLSNREGKERYIESGTGSRKGGGYCDSALY